MGRGGGERARNCAGRAQRGIRASRPLPSSTRGFGREDPAPAHFGDGQVLLFQVCSAILSISLQPFSENRKLGKLEVETDLAIFFHWYEPFSYCWMFPMCPNVVKLSYTHAIL